MTLSEKIAGVADQSAIESLIKQGEYAKSEQDVEKLIANLRDLEAAYEDAILASSTVVREEERLTERGVVFSSKKAEVDVLIVEGAYDKAVRRSAVIIKEYLKRESAWLKAQEIVVILGSEVERVTEKGIVIPESFDIASVGVLMYEGEYAKAGQRAKSLIQKIRALENTFNDASGLFALLIRERNRLDEKGVPLPETADPSPVAALLDAGDYTSAALCAQEILDLLKELEAAYDRAMQMADLLGSEINRVGEKGVVLPAGISLDPVLDAIVAGDFDGAVDAASDLIRQIREIEADYDRAVDLAGQVRDGSERLKGLGVSIPFDPSEIEDLITAGRYDEAIARAQEMLKDLDGLEAERLLNERSIKAFQDELDREIGRLKDRGIIVPYNTNTLASLIDAEEDEKAWEEAGNLLTGLRDLENLYDAAKRAQDRLVAETKRIREDGIVVPDYTGEVAKEMAAGDYRKAWETAGDRLLAILLIERDALDARAALDQLRAEIARLKKKGVVIADESNLVENLIGEGKTAAAKKAAASQLQHHLMTEGRFDAALAALKNSEEKKKQLLNKGVIVPEVPAAIGDLMNNGAYSDSLDAVRSFVALLIAADNQYNAAIAALKALSDELSRLQKKGVLVPDNRTAVEALISEGKYLPAQEQVRTEILLLRSLESGYDVARKARKALAERLASLKKKGVVVPFDLVATDALLEKGDYSGVIVEMHVLAKNLSATEHAFDAAQNALKTLKSEVARLTKKGLVIPESLSAVEDLIKSGIYPEAQKKAETVLRTLVVLESAYDGALEALEALKKEIARLTQKGLVIPESLSAVEDLIKSGIYPEAQKKAETALRTLVVLESAYDGALEALAALKKEIARLTKKGLVVPESLSAVKDLITSGNYPEAQKKAETVLRTLVVLESAYDGALEAFEALKQELARLTKKGVLVPDRTGVIEDLIGAGKYHEARTGAYDEIVSLRVIEQEYDNFTHSMGIFSSETDRLLTMGVKITDERLSVQKMADVGNYQEAIFRIGKVLDGYRLLEFEFESAQDALALLNKEIARLKKKGVVVAVVPDPTESLIAEGEYRKAREEANLLISDLRATESLFDSAIEALSLLIQEIARLKKKGVVIPENTTEVQKFIEKGEYHTARSTAEVTISELRRIESDYNAAIEALKGLKKEMARIESRGILMSETTDAVTQLIEKGSYSASRSEVSAIIQRLKKVEIAYESALEALTSLEQEIARIQNMGVLLPVTTREVTTLLASGAYGEAVSTAEKIHKQVRNIEIEYTTAIDALGDLVAEIERLHEKGVIIDDDITVVHLTIEKGSYVQARTMAEDHLSVIRAAEIEYDSALSTLAELKTEIQRLRKKSVHIDADTGPVEKLIKTGAYRKAKDQADSHLSALKKTEREYDSAIGALEQVQAEIERLVQKGVVITEDVGAIQAPVNEGAYKKAIMVADKMQGRLRERESDYDAAIGSLKSYLREQGRVAENGVPVPEESAAIQTYIEVGEYAQARSEAEALVSRVKSFEWEYELTMSAYESLKTEVERLKAQGIVITDDPGQVEEFIENGQYQNAKSISEGLLSKIKTTEWEYGLAKKALEALEREMVSGKKGKKGVKVDTEGIKATIREGRYRKAKSMAEELISTLRS